MLFPIMDFQLHPILEEDTHTLVIGECYHLLLHKNATLPWFILVPHTNETELHSLPEDLARIVHGIHKALAPWIQAYFDCSKVNFAAIGNLVPQLHIHMIGRGKGDACWPKPVWGHLEAETAYSPEEIQKIRAEIEETVGNIS